MGTIFRKLPIPGASQLRFYGAGPYAGMALVANSLINWHWPVPAP